MRVPLLPVYVCVCVVVAVMCVWIMLEFGIRDDGVWEGKESCWCFLFFRVDVINATDDRGLAFAEKWGEYYL